MNVQLIKEAVLKRVRTLKDHSNAPVQLVLSLLLTRWPVWVRERIPNLMMYSFYVGSLSESDMNECLQADANNCEQMCSNTEGSFACSCQRGFTLNSNGFNCNRKCDIM